MNCLNASAASPCHELAARVVALVPMLPTSSPNCSPTFFHASPLALMLLQLPARGEMIESVNPLPPSTLNSDQSHSSTLSTGPTSMSSVYLVSGRSSERSDSSVVPNCA